MLCNFSSPVLVRALPPVLMMEFLLGLFGNGLALFIFCFHLRPWKSSTVLLFNLAVTDFMLTLGLPLRAIYYLLGIRWTFSGGLCKLCLFMLAMNRSGSTFFLMAIAVDRYMRVVHPHHPVNSLSVTKATLGALGLWLVTISMTVHVFTLQHVNTTYCESFMVDTESRGNLSWHKFTFLFSFYMPLLVILYCTFHITGHLRKRQLAQQAKFKKALYFIIVVVVLFIVCFLPSNITLLFVWFKMLSFKDCASMEHITVVFYVTISLTYLNSVLDPLVYYFSSPAFKNICRKALHLPQEETVESTERKTRETPTHSISQL
ncbi:hydroxycarboxylic acid receptor 2-like [Austrofundulus limnaeus]|uniref:Hydroxycarboxylic acid receptor 2-like n=1 Tax=Austrofundulus limnaeus TaxID=52670 RepID=A0A2I4BYN8_AUSLI|nr:PREDICTED: hydroxycarboxylic acid receptor 2-like [Austrofundulus limnaeus]XP_013872824.1 PREDICTED: hydroxycarboxylic acid receptor 2-like [Austrofundulus limnaeus]